uniref:RecF/RecN/SMC N-terminal domain-containing protein n=1 Tax=Ditylenchus dipsaci TaxID=166011 RepID=A0A915DWI1_9BILA
MLPKYTNEVTRQFDEELLQQQVSKLDELRSALKTKGVNMGLLNDYNDRVKIYNAESELFQQISRQRDLHRSFVMSCGKCVFKNLWKASGNWTCFERNVSNDNYGGDASLDLVDSLDPFSEGISFGVRPPKKSWKQIVNLSGGEKPWHLWLSSLDFITLDYRNVTILAHLIKERTENAQFIVISLRNNMFEKGDRLVGIYKVSDCTKNVVVDNDPRKYIAVA